MCENDARFGLIGHHYPLVVGVSWKFTRRLCRVPNRAYVKNAAFPAISAGGLAAVAPKIARPAAGFDRYPDRVRNGGIYVIHALVRQI
jgi:hypothetical protein